MSVFRSAEYVVLSRRSRLLLNIKGIRLATGLLFAAAALQVPAQVAIDSVDDIVDPEAMLFVNRCLRCHPGIQAGTELANTHNRTVDSLEKTITRMQQYAGPMTEKEIADLVSLLRDPEYKDRIAEADLASIDTDAAAPPAPGAPPEDIFAKLYVNKCAICHTIGGGGSTGGDLAKTASWQLPQLQLGIRKMEPRVGPLTDAQVNGLAELLKDSKVKDRLAAAGLKPSATVKAPVFVPTPAPVKPVIGPSMFERDSVSKAVVQPSKPLDKGRVVRVIILGILALIGAAFLFRLEKQGH